MIRRYFYIISRILCGAICLSSIGCVVHQDQVYKDFLTHEGVFLNSGDSSYWDRKEQHAAIKHITRNQNSSLATRPNTGNNNHKN